MLNVYDFCEENLSNYEKTMLRLAVSFGAAGLYVLKENDIMALSNLLKIKYANLEKALHISDNDVNHFIGLKFGDEIYEGEFLPDYALFNVIVNFHFIFKSLDEISDKTDMQHLKSNIELFKNILYNFDLINATTATYECMYHNCFSLNYTIYSNSDFNPMDSIEYLQLFLIDDKYHEQNKDILPIIYQLLWYEFYTRTNTLYLITIAQIIKHSPFFDDSVCEIAGEFYSHLLFMLSNARVISIQINSLSYTVSSKPESRTKEDNTTRLQVLYGYDNYDVYAIRLDLAHEGEGFVHYNNKSPGGIKCCLFSKYEYQAIIKKNPKLVECFIEYGDRWALKERKNCNMTKGKTVLYDSIRKAKAHDRVFLKTYTEENITLFIELLKNMLPQSCHVPIDREEVHAKYCFNYDKIMGGVFCLYLAYLSSNEKEINKVINYIVGRAINYNLISELDRENYSCIDGICIIIECAKERLFGVHT